MSKGKRETVRFRRGDYWRAVLSDTTPAELPIVVSNDGFTETFISSTNLVVSQKASLSG